MQRQLRKRKRVNALPTDRQTDRRTDTVEYRVAFTRLKRGREGGGKKKEKEGRKEKRREKGKKVGKREKMSLWSPILLS